MGSTAVNFAVMASRVSFRRVRDGFTDATGDVKEFSCRTAFDEAETSRTFNKNKL